MRRRLGCTFLRNSFYLARTSGTFSCKELVERKVLPNADVKFRKDYEGAARLDDVKKEGRAPKRAERNHP